MIKHCNLNSIIPSNKNNIFILDGPDCTGKTTFCEQLANINQIPYYHLTYYDDPKKHIGQFTYINTLIQDKLHNPESNQGLVVDRYILSECVYSDVYRNSKYFDRNIFDILWNEFMLTEDYTTIITLPYDKQRYLDFIDINKSEGREEMYNENYDLIYDRYNFYYDLIKNKNSVYRYDIFDNMNII